MRALRFVPAAWDDTLYWPGQDKKTLKRVNQLIAASTRDPFAGIGKPKALRGDLSGYWSRRIDETNRLVYRANDAERVIVACRFHYDGRGCRAETAPERQRSLPDAPQKKKRAAARFFFTYAVTNLRNNSRLCC